MKPSGNSSKKARGFTDEERAAMREYAKELTSGGKNEGEAAVLAKISSLPEPDRSLAKHIHALIRKNAPELLPKTWYGMPAYANAAGKTICFFQGASKFKARYATLGFNDGAHLDDGTMWPVAFALTKFTPEVETKIVLLLRTAVQ